PRPERGVRAHGAHGRPPAARDFPPPVDSAQRGPKHRHSPPVSSNRGGLDDLGADAPPREPRRGREPRSAHRSMIDSTDALHIALTTDAAVTQDRLPRVERRRRQRPS
ncbi:MAG: hypothetical protein J2P20_20750, partial [Pseudonocardia sp.]|nr:hypothetical protein [Pseudonocardia sp.]